MESSVLVWTTHARYSGIIDIFRCIRTVSRVTDLNLGLLFFKIRDSLILRQIKAALVARGVTVIFVFHLSVRVAEDGGDAK